MTTCVTRDSISRPKLATSSKKQSSYLPTYLQATMVRTTTMTNPCRPKFPDPRSRLTDFTQHAEGLRELRRHYVDASSKLTVSRICRKLASVAWTAR